MVLQLQGLALHLQELWLGRLRAPACIRPGGAMPSLMAYFPHPPRMAGPVCCPTSAAASVRPGCGPGGGATAAAARGGKGLSGCAV